MSLERKDRNKSTPEILADLTGEPVENFEYDGEIPDPAEQEWEDIDDE